MTNDENESANIKASNPLTPQQDNRIFESIPVRPAPWSKQSEAGSAMNRERALGMFLTANQWLYERIAEDATCDCGNCYLCAYNFFAAPASPAALRDEADDLVDEVQHRMDQVVEAAVEWHQAGQEGAEWFEAAEKLGAAINSLLELRGDPQSQMPRRWCSVHNCEELKYESLEHELRSATQDEAGTAAIRKQLEREVATNKFIDQLLRERAALRKQIAETNSAATPPSTLAQAAAEECEALITCLLSDDEKESTRQKFTAIIERCFSGGEQ